MSRKDKIIKFLLSIVGLCLSVIAILIGILLAVGNAPNTLWFGVGQSLMASGIFGLILLLHGYSKQKAESNSQDELAKSQKDSQIRLMNTIQELEDLIQLDRKLSKSGLNDVCTGDDKRAIRKTYLEHMEAANREIAILARKADGFVDDFLSVKNKILSGDIKNIRILVVHPEEEGFVRSITVHKKWGQDEVVKRILHNTMTIIEANKADSRVEIRWDRNFPPSFTISIFDDVLYMTPYLVGKSHKDAATLVTRSGGLLFGEYYKHFNELWNSAVIPDAATCEKFSSQLERGGKS